MLLVRDGSLERSWDLPGGYLLYGERPEAGLCRELREELRIEVRAMRLISTCVDDYRGAKGYSLNLFYRVWLQPNQPVAPAAEIQTYGWYPFDALPRLRYRSVVEVLSQLRDGLPTVVEKRAFSACNRIGVCHGQ